MFKRVERRDRITKCNTVFLIGASLKVQLEKCEYVLDSVRELLLMVLVVSNIRYYLEEISLII